MSFGTVHLASKGTRKWAARHRKAHNPFMQPSKAATELTKEEYADFAVQVLAAKQAELASWKDDGTHRVEKYDATVHRNVCAARWVLTFKAADPRRTPCAATLPDGRRVKARLCIRGFGDVDVDLVSKDSPTASKDAVLLALS